MRIFVFYAATLLVAFNAKAAGAEEDVGPPGKTLFRSLPEDARADFLIFSLGHGYTKDSTKLLRNSQSQPEFRFPDALGIDGERIRAFESLEYPENFTSNLYVWIRARFDLDEMKMRALILSRSVCLANGSCIDINDIGGLCCPF